MVAGLHRSMRAALRRGYERAMRRIRRTPLDLHQSIGDETEMARISNTTGSMTTLRCDITGCRSRFVTASMAGKARKQAAAEGWVRISGKKVKFSDGTILSDRLVDLCPECEQERRNKITGKTA